MINLIIWLVNILFCFYIGCVGYWAWGHFQKCLNDLQQWNTLYHYMISKNAKVDLASYPLVDKFLSVIKGIPEAERNAHICFLITEDYKFRIDTELLKAQSAMEQLPNLGLLGTVLGLAIGYWFFDGKSMDIVISCFQTALWTTLIGLGAMIAIKIKGIDTETEIEYERFLGYIKQLELLTETGKCIMSNSELNVLHPK